MIQYKCYSNIVIYSSSTDVAIYSLALLPRIFSKCDTNKPADFVLLSNIMFHIQPCYKNKNKICSKPLVL